MTILIDSEFELGQLVYLKHDPDQLVRQIVMIKYSFAESISYLLSCGTTESVHYAQELSTTQNQAITLNLHSNEDVRD